ncbi:hypothetical protein FVEG_07808 [Fusarium verticillioides 7600]|uniref:Myb-like domain-containing protein n=1 Tax=Gibberella moniliformis (strain M3125 / FGSC 7600) TaxID=334819 RepID=W7M9U0_GIBM7|nr:hypothetical protein FVEG_07808 [Fusarium verticillioides 7600]EWG47776.1 hypothetical protein FVEG_07808 [Fusarium verticillioides 7600]RBQ85683.1 hypothetical protein FVER53263_07808 [Fusarium verticillioides]
MHRFPIPPPTWAAYKQHQEYYDRLYQGLNGPWYNPNTAVPGFVELPGHSVPRPATVNQASSFQLKPKARGRRVTIATASDEENGVVTDTEGNITDSSNPVSKSKMTTKAKGKDKAVQTESENESSAGETSVLSFVACLKDPKWSLSEDCRLRSMKEAGETWAFISGSLCKTKDDVRARWKILQSQLLAKDTIKGTDTDNAAEEVSVDDTTDEDDGNDGDDEESAEGDEDSDADDEDSDDDEESDEDDEDDENPDDDEDSDDNEESNESDEADEDSDDDTNKIPKSTGHCKWHQGEMKHLQEHVYGAMYPPHIYPQPNAHLVKRDCALLATIDSQYKRSRWLEMQANFYNVTGQMVPLVSFKARFERAEAEKTERSKTRELEKRLNKVEDWIAKQEHEKSADSDGTEDSDDSDE